MVRFNCSAPPSGWARPPFDAPARYLGFRLRVAAGTTPGAWRIAGPRFAFLNLKPSGIVKEMKQEALDIVKILQDNGFVAYFAGGCVRDMLRGVEPSDFDIVTSARPEEVEKLFSQTVAIGKAFGVISVIKNNHNFQVATFRAEAGYFDQRRPSQVTFTNAEEDAKRRDFTINGLFYDPIAQKTIDFVGGAEDLKKHLVRFIGDPDERIQEDHLRLLRAIRFKITLEFQYAPETFAAVRTHALLIREVSAERIRDELSKIMASPRRAQGLVELSESQLLAQIIPEIERLKAVAQPFVYHKEGDVFVHTYLSIKALPDDTPPHLAWAVLLHDIAKPQTAQKEEGRIIFHNHAQESGKLTEEILRRLKFANFEIETIVWLVENHMKIFNLEKMRPGKRLALVLDPRFHDLIELIRADASGTYPTRLEPIKKIEEIVKEALAWKKRSESKAKHLITGEDLIKLGLAPGAQFKEILEEINDLTIADKFQTKEEARSYVKQKYLKNG